MPKIDLSWKNIYDRLFLWLFLVDVILRLVWLDKPTGSLIFDEWYYVNVARVILGLPQSVGSNGKVTYPDAAIGLDPNHEHLPLAKLFIAFSIHLLGDNGFAWRIPSVVFGSVAILAFYLLLKKVSKYPSVPLIATFLFSFDNLVYVQSRIAILDIFTLTFMIVGFYWYFSDHTYLSALGMTLSTLCKETGGAGFIIILVIHIARFVRDRKPDQKWDSLLSWLERYVGTFVLSFLVLLGLLDHFWVNSFAWPTDHIQYILTYSSALTSSCPNGIISCPWQWLMNHVQIPYLTVNVATTSGGVTANRTTVQFIGAANFAISILTIPSILYLAHDYYSKRSDLSLLFLVWFAVTYLPYYPAVIIDHRVTYLFYFLMTIPSICAGIAYMIADQNPPKWIVLLYLGVVAFSFYLMFPFKVIPS